jgi:hypothetical protein
MNPTKHQTGEEVSRASEAKAEDAKAERLAAALRDNLKRRKAQSRARQQDPVPRGDETD